MMLAQPGNESILESRDYIFEPKLDGYRILFLKQNGKVRLLSRSGLNVTDEYPGIIAARIKSDCILDGEVVIFDDDGNPSFAAMQDKRNRKHAVFVVFDILEKGGKNLRKMPLLERKKILDGAVKESDRIKIMVYTPNGEALWKQMVSRHLEGVVAKKKNSHYVDKRSHDWLKIKSELTADCVIIGYTKKIRSISSLALGLYDKGKIVYSGKVGTGFTESFLDSLKKKMKDSKEKRTMPEDGQDVRLVRPELVCEIRYLHYTKDKRFRAPVFLRLRDDKAPEECTTDQVKSG